MAKPDIKALSKLLRDMLGRKAALSFQNMDEMAEGDTGKTNGEVIATNIMTAACAGERWAIELLRDTVYGKPGQAVQDDDADRTDELRLEEYTRKHLNDIAGIASAGDLPAVQPQPKAAKPDENPAHTPDAAAAATRRLMDLPKDGDRHSKNS